MIEFNQGMSILRSNLFQFCDFYSRDVWSAHIVGFRNSNERTAPIANGCPTDRFGRNTEKSQRFLPRKVEVWIIIILTLKFRKVFARKKGGKPQCISNVANSFLQKSEGFTL